MLINRKTIEGMVNYFRVNDYEKDVANIAFNLITAVACRLWQVIR